MKELEEKYLCPVCGDILQTIPAHNESRVQCITCGHGINNHLTSASVCPVCFQTLILSKEGFAICSNPTCQGYYLKHLDRHTIQNTHFEIAHTNLYYFGKQANQPFMDIATNDITRHLLIFSGEDYISVDDLLAPTKIKSYSESCFICKLILKIFNKLHPIP